MDSSAARSNSSEAIPGRTLMFHDRLSLMQIVSVALVVTGAFLWLRGHGAAAPIPPATTARAAAGRS